MSARTGDNASGFPSPPTPTSDVPRLPPRVDTTHKGQVGRVAIVAGCRGMSGAACLAGLGALRGGAGLVRVHCPESIQPIVAASDPCLMTVPLAETGGGVDCTRADGEIDRQWPTVFAIGPGFGLGGPARELTRLLMSVSQPLVVDADGLNHVADLDRESKQGESVWGQRADRQTVITPHPGEMTRLRASAGMAALRGDDDEARLRIAHEYACYAGATVVYKGHSTVVCTPDQAYVNTTGNPGMATGGMGDVLTGLIAALLGQGLDAFDAARLGVYCHGTAADMCARRIGPIGYLARDVAEMLPAALSKVYGPRIGFQ